MQLPSGLDSLSASVVLGATLLVLTMSILSYARRGFRRPTRRAFYAGKHVVITGGSSGIGKELARILVRAGASVTLVARNKARLLATANELESCHDSQQPRMPVHTAVADCSSPTQVDEMLLQVERSYGPIDILVNSAGKAVGSYFENSTPHDVSTEMNNNYFTQAYPTLAVFKRMAERRNGHIVFVSSMSGLVGVFGQASYVSAKFAVRGLAETLYYEAKPYGIDVTLAFPPDTKTPGFDVERATMPKETLEISEGGGLFTAEAVAESIADATMKRRFRVSVGLSGSLLDTLTKGLSPGFSFIDALILPIARVVAPFVIWDQNRIIRRGHTIRFPNIERQAANQ